MFYREKAYTRINWKNRPNLSTPLGAKNLNKMDATLNELDDRIIEVSSEVERDSLTIGFISDKVNALKENVDENTSQINELSSLAEDVNGLKIVNTASGTTAYMDDASNMNIENIVFYGESKQIPQDILFSPSVAFLPLTESGITVTPVANNGFKISGTNTSTDSSVYYDLYYSKTDMLCSETFVFDTGVPDGTIDYLYYEYPASGGSFMKLNTSAKTSTITVGKGISGQQIRLYIPKGKTINTTIYPTVKPVDPNPDYPQPIESKIVNRVDVLGKNWLKFPYYGSANKVTEGVEFITNSDETITVNGTSTGDAYLDLYNNPNEMLVNEPIIFSKGAVNTVTLFYFERIDGKWSVGQNTTESQTEIKITPSANATGQIFRITVQNGKTANNIKVYPMVRLASITDGTWEPYQKQTVNLSAPIELNGIGGVRDTDKVKKFGVVVFDGSENEGWYTMDTATAGVKRLYTRRFPAKASASNNFIPNILCTHYKPTTPQNTYSKVEGITVSMQPSDGGNTYIYIYDENFNTADISLWKAHLQANPMTVVYELETPEETSLPTADQTAIKALHSYKPNTVVMNDADAEMDVQYVADPRLYIDKKFEALASAIVNQ